MIIMFCAWYGILLMSFLKTYLLNLLAQTIVPLHIIYRCLTCPVVNLMHECSPKYLFQKAIATAVSRDILACLMLTLRTKDRSVDKHRALFVHFCESRIFKAIVHCSYFPLKYFDYHCA